MKPKRHQPADSFMRHAAVRASRLVSAGLVGGECAAGSTILGRDLPDADVNGAGRVTSKHGQPDH